MRKFTIWLACLLFFASMGLANAQTKVITGKVTGADDGLPIPGVTIVVPGTSTGTVTDIDGNYQLTIDANVTTLRFSYVGMDTQDVVLGNRTVINVTMSMSTTSLEEVIVVAYGTTTKEAYTGSAQVVNSKKLESRAVTSALSAIEGNTTGVQVLSASGQPGSSPSIVIRGVGTLNGSSTPLYIVDGVQFEGALTSLNPDDIESMTVLKDAASTSLYGSRAAAGVVMITTKSGKKSKGFTATATYSKGVLSPGVPFYEKATPQQHYELMWEGYKNSLIDGGLSASAAANEASATIYDRLAVNPFNVPNDQIVGTDGKINPNAQVIFKGIDWYDALQRTGQRDNYSFNVSGGNEKFDVYFSTAYLEEEGYIIESAYNRLTTRLNTNFRINDRFTVGGSVNLSITNQEGPFSRGSAYANPFFFAKSMGSIYPVYIVDPATGDYILDAAGKKQYDLGEGYAQYGIKSRPINLGRHAVAEVNLNDEKRKTNNIGARYYAEYHIIDGLKARINYGIDVQDYIRKEYENNVVGDGAPSGRYSETRFRRTVKNFTQILTYNKRFDSGHNIDITLGHESYDRHYSQNSGMKNTQTVVGISEFDNFSIISSLDGYSSDKTLEGYFARFNYDYNSKYYLSASVRRDGSSVFAKDARWGNFYSVGGSWRIDQEDFIKNIEFINSLKLRASYGQVGSDNLGSFYISQPLYSILPNAGEPGIFWSDLGNNALEWETTESWDLALEFAIFNRRITGSIEYYRKTSSELLYNVPIALSNGLDVKPDNIADIYNEGVEFSVTGRIFNTPDFKWDMTLQASTLRNEITDIPDPFLTGSKRWAVGHSRYEYFQYHYAGVDPANGDALFYMWEEDENGEFIKVLNEDGSWKTTNIYTDADRGYTGETSIPDVFGSITNNISYKGFELSALITYAIGGKILDYGYADMMHPGEYGSALSPDLLNGWRKPGDITDIPRMENGNSYLNVANSTRYLTDGSYIALRNLSLAYTFNQKFVKDFGLSSLKVFLTGENLFLKSARKGLDPQYNLSGTPDGRDYNPSRVISAGVKISF